MGEVLQNRKNQVYQKMDPIMFDINVNSDDRGRIGIFQESELGFSLNRIYYLFDVPSQSIRGSHAHRILEQVLIAVSGSFEVELDNGVSEPANYHLNNPAKGLWVPRGHWRTLSNFSSGAVCLVLASEEYDSADYIRDYSEFVEWARAK
jgi:dTDP-4-dehydrorhamnose 3,5-epimerase-like enzyme